MVLLEGHEGYVDVAAWSPTDDVIVTGSSDRCHYHHSTMLQKKEQISRINAPAKIITLRCFIKRKRSTMIISGKPSSGIFMATKLQIGWVSLFPFSFSSSSR